MKSYRHTKTAEQLLIHYGAFSFHLQNGFLAQSKERNIFLIVSNEFIIIYKFSAGVDGNLSSLVVRVRWKMDFWKLVARSGANTHMNTQKSQRNSFLQSVSSTPSRQHANTGIYCIFSGFDFRTPYQS